MRTTLTLDDDVAALLERVRAGQKLTLKDAVNEGLRRGLAQLEEPRPSRRKRYTVPVDLGDCLVGSIDDVAEVLAIAEGEGHL